MTQHLKYLNPYSEGKQWFKGNLHAHCSENSSCSTISLKMLIQEYIQFNYDFLSVSDHDRITIIPDELSQDQIVLIPAYEYSRGKHIQIMGVKKVVLDEPQATISQVQEANALVILNHPNWGQPPHWSIEEIMELVDFDGIEIYNGMADRLVGQSLATDVWDAALTRNHRCWGYASDDAHELFDINRAWVMAKADACNADTIQSALKLGSFYASTGAEIQTISLIQNKLSFETAEVTAYRFIGPNGQILKTHLGHLAEYWIEGWEDYIRVEGYNHLGWFWTQPFFGE
ncbi:PHP domain-containing protein [bacterium]|nr:PHP domain-containing protein [bacterium]